MSNPLLEPIVYLVDDDDAVRGGLSLLLGTHAFTVQAFASAEDFLAGWHPESVGCLVLDIRLGGISGLTLQALLAERGIATPVVIITGHGDVDACRRAFRHGAIDFLTKPVDEAALVAAIGRGIRADLARHAEATSRADARERLDSLSERERQVLTLMLQGLPNKLIARRLDLSTRTVESHRARVFSKLEADSLAALIKRVVEVAPEMAAAAPDET